MEKQIREELKQIESQENVSILFACESGSRGWGFPSPDSDYDVRFIYVKPKNAYFSIQKQNDFLEFPITGDLDINGWDIKKTLQLLLSSNPTIFEWLQSPVIYQSKAAFPGKFLELARQYFIPKTAVHHYLGLAKKHIIANQGKATIKIKHYFYILRPLLAAMHIIDKKTVPPMEFHLLLKQIETDTALTTAINNLIEKKAETIEKEPIEKIPVIQSFIDTRYAGFDAMAGHFPTYEKKDPEALDDFFRDLL